MMSREDFLNAVQKNRSCEELHRKCIKRRDSGLKIKVFDGGSIPEGIAKKDQNLDDLFIMVEIYTHNWGAPSIGHLVWAKFTYHEYCSYGFRVYECSKTDEKKCILKENSGYLCSPIQREGYYMWKDLWTIGNIIEKMRFATYE